MLRAMLAVFLVDWHAGGRRMFRSPAETVSVKQIHLADADADAAL